MLQVKATGAYYPPVATTLGILCSKWRNYSLRITKTNISLGCLDPSTLRHIFLEIAWQNWPFKIGLSLLDFKQLLVDSGSILQCLGFGKGLKPFGKGAPSEGWPSDLDWTDFKGPKRFCDIKKGTIMIKIVLRGPGNHFFKIWTGEARPRSWRLFHNWRKRKRGLFWRHRVGSTCWNWKLKVTFICEEGLMLTHCKWIWAAIIFVYFPNIHGHTSEMLIASISNYFPMNVSTPQNMKKKCYNR